MTYQDKEMKDYIRSTRDEIHLTDAQKQRMKQTVMAELTRRRQSGAVRLRHKIQDLMDTTYEISFVPVVTGVCALLLLINFSFLAPLVLQEPVAKKTYYLQQVTTDPDGDMRIVYQTVVKED